MAKGYRVAAFGGPEAMVWESLDLGELAPGRSEPMLRHRPRLRHSADPALSRISRTALVGQGRAHADFPCPLCVLSACRLESTDLSDQLVKLI